jgi:hypothetical protein
MDFADLVRNPRVKEDPFSRRRLPGIDVGHDADVATPIEGNLSGHYFQLSAISHQLSAPS